METVGVIAIIGGLLAVCAVLLGCLKSCYSQQSSGNLKHHHGKPGKRKGKDGDVWMTGIAVHDGTGNYASDRGEYFGGSTGGDAGCDTGNTWSGGGCDSGGGGCDSGGGGGCDSGGGGGSCDV